MGSSSLRGAIPRKAPSPPTRRPHMSGVPPDCIAFLQVQTQRYPEGVEYLLLCFCRDGLPLECGAYTAQARGASHHKCKQNTSTNSAQRTSVPPSARHAAEESCRASLVPTRAPRSPSRTQTLDGLLHRLQHTFEQPELRDRQGFVPARCNGGNLKLRVGPNEVVRSALFRTGGRDLC